METFEKHKSKFKYPEFRKYIPNNVNDFIAEAKKINMGLENITKKSFNKLTPEEYTFISALSRKLFTEKFTLLTNMDNFRGQSV